MSAHNNIGGISGKLWKNPSASNWAALRVALKGSSVKYYKTVYHGKLKGLEDLKKGKVLLLDGRYHEVATIPMYKKSQKGGIEGALEYIRGLSNANMVD